MGTVFLAGNPDFAPAGGVTLSLPNLFDAGVARDISVTGGGTVDITGPAYSLSSGTVVDVALGSTLALNNALALGSLPLLMEGAGTVKDNVSVTLNSGDAIQPGTAGSPRHPGHDRQRRAALRLRQPHAALRRDTYRSASTCSFPAAGPACWTSPAR